MSDINTTPFEAAIETLREREHQLDTDMQLLITRRDEVREMIVLLTSRKPRAPRKPRAVVEVAGPVAEEPIAGAPTPFAFVPPAEPAEEAA